MRSPSRGWGALRVAGRSRASARVSTVSSSEFSRVIMSVWAALGAPPPGRAAAAFRPPAQPSHRAVVRAPFVFDRRHAAVHHADPVPIVAAPLVQAVDAVGQRPDLAAGPGQLGVHAAELTA